MYLDYTKKDYNQYFLWWTKRLIEFNQERFQKSIFF